MAPGAAAAGAAARGAAGPAGKAAHREASARSYLVDGRCVGWYGPAPDGWAVAIDAEVATAQVPERLAERFGTDRFWERWTRAESLCKLADTPIVMWTREHGLDSPPGSLAVWRTVRLGDLVVSVAMAPA